MIKLIRSKISVFREAVRRERRRRFLGELRRTSGLGDGAWILHGLVLANRPEVVVEIGSASGWSTCVIGSALRENNCGRIHAIDPHTITNWNDDKSVDTYAIIRSNIQRLDLEDYVSIVRNTSQKAAETWTQGIDLLFIDGDHSYEGVKGDWEGFLKHMKPFSLVIFHDTMWETGQVNEQYKRDDMGVPQFVDELRNQGYPVITSPLNCGLSIVQPVIGGIGLTRQR